MTAIILRGDARNLPLPDCSVDAIVCDPPYALEDGFMGQAWDRFASPLEFQTWCEAWAREALRVLKPGAHLLAFGGTRSAHRLACGVEDAGFEIRDSIAWLTGQGYPKSVNVSAAIDAAAGAERPVVDTKSAGASSLQRASRVEHGYRTALTSCTPESIPVTAPATESARQWSGWGSALKPACEPITVARKPFAGTIAGNVLEHGTGALNIDACRIAGEPLVTFDRIPGDRDRESWRTGTGENRRVVDQGRWPTNVVLDESMADQLDEQTGTLTSGANPIRRTSDKFATTYGEFEGRECVAVRGADSGGASRFFPVFRYEAKAPAHERPVIDGVSHPTPKPLDLVRWLVNLVTPPGGLVLDAFAGSGTTLEAAVVEGFDVIGIEQDPIYLPLIRYRIDRAQRRLQPGISRLRGLRAPKQSPDQLPFDLTESAAT